jgi:hypothetical protein
VLLSDRTYSSRRKYLKSFGHPVLDALASCTALQTLELRPEHVENWNSDFQRLLSLRAVKITVAVCEQLAGRNADFPKYPRFDKVWIKVEQLLSGESPSLVMRQKVVDFEWSVGKWREATRLKLIGILNESPKKITADLSPLEVTCSLSNRFPTRLATKNIVIWGLPSTNAMRVKLVKEEKRDNEQRNASGLSIRQDEALRKRREGKKHSLTVKEIEEVKADLREREEKRAEAEKEEQRREERNKKNRQTKLNRKIRKAGEMKKTERKRVSDA